jgi:hypothetical protein
MPAGICIPNVMDAKQVPVIAARRRRIMVGAVGSFPQRPRMEELSLHSLNNAASNSVDCTLQKSVCACSRIYLWGLTE